MLSEEVKNIKFNQVISIYKNKDIEIYLAHTGLIEIGFTFAGSHKQSNSKNHFSYTHVKEMIAIASEVIYYYHRDRNRTVYCDIYNKDSYTLKREKLALSLGFVPLKEGEYFDVGGDNIWVIPR